MSYSTGSTASSNQHHSTGLTASSHHHHSTGSQQRLVTIITVLVQQRLVTIITVLVHLELTMGKNTLVTIIIGYPSIMATTTSIRKAHLGSLTGTFIRIQKGTMESLLVIRASLKAQKEVQKEQMVRLKARKDVQKEKVESLKA